MACMKKESCTIPCADQEKISRRVVRRLFEFARWRGSEAYFCQFYNVKKKLNSEGRSWQAPHPPFPDLRMDSEYLARWTRCKSIALFHQEIGCLSRASFNFEKLRPTPGVILLRKLCKRRIKSIYIGNWKKKVRPCFVAIDRHNHCYFQYQSFSFLRY